MFPQPPGHRGIPALLVSKAAPLIVAPSPFTRFCAPPLTVENSPPAVLLSPPAICRPTAAGNVERTAANCRTTSSSIPLSSTHRRKLAASVVVEPATYRRSRRVPTIICYVVKTAADGGVVAAGLIAPTAAHSGRLARRDVVLPAANASSKPATGVVGPAGHHRHVHRWRNCRAAADGGKYAGGEVVKTPYYCRKVSASSII